MENCRRCILESREQVSMTATSTAASSLPPVRTSCHVPLSLMTSISEETIALWLKLGALEKLEQAVLDGYGDQLCGKTSRIPQVNKFLKQVPLFQTKIKEIHQAVSQGRLRDVQHLIDRKKLAFCRDHNGASPLHKAVIFGHQDVIEYLVKRYPGVIHIRDHQGRTALHYAAFLPDGGEIYQYLLAFGADERAMDVYGRQPSYYLDGQNESTLRQLREGSTLNGIRKIKPRYYGQVSAGQPFANTNRPTVSKSQIREIISEGNMSALEDLVLQGQGDRLLGETSSVPKIQSFLNIVPIYMERIYDVHRAVMRDQLEHVVILLENRKLALARDQLGATPLHKAVWFGHYKIAHYISRQFPETLNAIDMEGRTALHYAASLKDNKNMYGILIEAGANKGVFDNKGKMADYYSQYPEHLNLEEVIKRCHKVNANYLANTANRIKGKSPVRQTPPPTNGTLSSPRSEDNNGSSKENSQSNDSGNENELVSMFQKDKLNKRFDVNSANIRKWVNAKDVEKLTKAVMDGYGDKVVRLHKIDDDEEKNPDQFHELVERINAIHAAVSNDNLDELQNQLEEKDFALAKDHMGMTPLHKAVLLRKTKIVAFLIEKFPETINAKNKNGLTALHYAAAMSRKDGQQIYKMLVQAGADSKIRDNHGRTPDYYKTHLITMPNKGMMKSRLAGGRHSETLNRYSKQGVLERMTAALQKGDVDLLHELVLEGHGKHLLGKSSWNEEAKVFLKELPTYLSNIKSFQESIRIGDVNKVKELVSSNEKLMRARDETGALPFHIAAAAGATQVLHFLGKNFPNMLNVKDANGRTALHIASQNQNHHICKLLKQLGADSKNLDQKGRTADSYLQGGKSGHYKAPLNSSSDSMFSSSGKEALEQTNEDISKEDPIDEENATQDADDENEATGNENNDEDKDVIDQHEEGEPECNEENDLVNDEEDVDAENEIRKLSTDATDDVSTEEPVEDKEESEDCIISTDPELQDTEENEDVPEPGTDEVDELVETLENIETNAEAENETQEEENAQDLEIAANDNENEEEKDQEEEEKSEEVGQDGVEGDDAEESNDKAGEEETEPENTVAEDENNEEELEEKEGEVTEPPDDVEAEDKAEDENEEDPESKDQDALEGAGEENETAEENEEVVPEDNDDADKPEDSEAVDEETTNLLKRHSVSEVTVAEVGSGNVSNIENADAGDTAETEEPAKTEEDKEAEENEAETAEAEKSEETPPIAPEESNDNPEECSNEDIPDEEKAENEEGNNADEGKEDNETSEDKDNENAETAATEEHEEEKMEENGEEKMEETAEEKTEDTEEEKTEEAEEEKTEEVAEEKMEETEEENTEEPEDEKTEETEETLKDGEENPVEEVPGENEVEEKENEVTEENDEKEEEAKEDGDNIAGQEEKDEQEEIADEKTNEDDKSKELVVQENEVNDEPPTENGDVANDEDENKDESSKDAPHQTKDHLDELIEHWIKDGDLLRLEHVVLAGQGDRLIERTSDDKQVQDFLDLVPIYMAKIRAVHEAVAKGHLREVRSVLTRKRFALSRDHVGASPLHLAVLYGHTDVSTYIISHFPETMDGPDNEGRTPLHYAAAIQDNGILYRLLKAAGADEHVEDKSGHSPKYYMSRPGSLSLMQLLEPYSSSE